MQLFLTENPFDDPNFPTVTPSPTEREERGSTNSHSEVHQPTHNRISLTANTLAQVPVGYSSVCPSTTHPVCTVVYYTTIAPWNIGFGEGFNKSLPCPRHATTTAISSKFSGRGCAIAGMVILSSFHKKYLVSETIYRVPYKQHSNSRPALPNRCLGLWSLFQEI